MCKKIKDSSGKAAKISLHHTSRIEGVDENTLVEVDEANRIVNVACKNASKSEPSINRVEVDAVHFVDRTKV